MDLDLKVRVVAVVFASIMIVATMTLVSTSRTTRDIVLKYNPSNGYYRKRLGKSSFFLSAIIVIVSLALSFLLSNFLVENQIESSKNKLKIETDRQLREYIVESREKLDSLEKRVEELRNQNLYYQAKFDSLSREKILIRRLDKQNR